MDSDYQEYPYRYLIVILFTLPSLVNGMCWVVLTPISAKIQQIYDVSDTLVTLVPLLFIALYVFITFPSNWVLDSKSIRIGITIGAIMTALGAGIRCLVNVSFTYVIIGQLFCAIGQPFIINAPAKIATYWFKDQNRPVATAVLASINTIGTAVGFVIPSIIVDQSEPDKTISKKQVLTLMLIEFGMSIIGAILVVILFREKPPTPPSLGAQTEKMPFRQSIREMFKSSNFIWLLIGFSFANGLFNFFGSMINYLVQPFGYTSGQTSLLGVLMICVGIVATFLLSYYVQKTEKYKRVFMLCSVLSVASLFLLVGGIYYLEMFWVVIIASILLGFAQIPLIPLSFDFGCEIVFPVGEAQVTGVLMSGGQIIGVLETVLVQHAIRITDKNSACLSGIFVSLLLAMGSIGFFLIKEDLRRKDKERAKENAPSMVSSLMG